MFTFSYFLNTSPEQFLNALLPIFEKHQIKHEMVAALGDHNWETDIDLHTRYPKWLLVEWPSLIDMAAYELHEQLSEGLKTKAAAFSITEQHWALGLFDNGATTDRFLSDFFTHVGIKHGRDEMMKIYGGRPSVVAEYFGVPVQNISPYMETAPEYSSWDEVLAILGIGPRAKWRPGKAFADDKYKLDDPRVGYDFVKRLGVPVHEDERPGKIRCEIEAKFWSKLPKSEYHFG